MLLILHGHFHRGHHHQHCPECPSIWWWNSKPHRNKITFILEAKNQRQQHMGTHVSYSKNNPFKNSYTRCYITGEYLELELPLLLRCKKIIGYLIR